MSTFPIFLKVAKMNKFIFLISMVLFSTGCANFIVRGSDTIGTRFAKVGTRVVFGVATLGTTERFIYRVKDIEENTAILQDLKETYNSAMEKCIESGFMGSPQCFAAEVAHGNVAAFINHLQQVDIQNRQISAQMEMERQRSLQSLQKQIYRRPTQCTSRKDAFGQIQTTCD